MVHALNPKENPIGGSQNPNANSNGIARYFRRFRVRGRGRQTMLGADILYMLTIKHYLLDH